MGGRRGGGWVGGGLMIIDGEGVGGVKLDWSNERGEERGRE